MSVTGHHYKANHFYPYFIGMADKRNVLRENQASKRFQLTAIQKKTISVPSTTSSKLSENPEKMIPKTV